MALKWLSTALFTALALTTTASSAQEAGWHYSPLPEEGDRATMGCDRKAGPGSFTCIAVRCEDDFSTGLYVHSSRPTAVGEWVMTVDRENATLVAEASTSPYQAQFVDRADWLLERIREGTFIYLRHADDQAGNFAFIDLGGSLYAINNALSYCAPRTPSAGQPSQSD